MACRTCGGNGGTYRIRLMNRSDVDIAVAWAAREGWNPGRHDAECFFVADPQGFFIGELDGTPVGVISMVNYGDSFAFGGFYIVAPEYRNRDYGIQLYRTAMEYAGHRTVGGDGVLAQQENYKKMGFRTAYRNVRYQGVGGGGQPDGVVPAQAVDFAVLLAYDTRHFPAPRETFLRAWIGQPDIAAYAVLDGAAIAGYGVVRSCVTGYKIGPLFAERADVAETLFQALAAHAPGAPLFLDVPEPNAEAVALAKRHGMTMVFETARMYRGEIPALPVDSIFGVTSFELG
ncbi:MAG: hypothetical protein QG656_1893 [Candidatus Hydrogenedentes bacterium]|nr:hypothetical protein [Candidatus Hydrogenedentota bacterium]